MVEILQVFFIKNNRIDMALISFNSCGFILLTKNEILWTSIDDTDSPGYINHLEKMSSISQTAVSNIKCAPGKDELIAFCLACRVLAFDLNYAAMPYHREILS